MPAKSAKGRMGRVGHMGRTKGAALPEEGRNSKIEHRMIRLRYPTMLLLAELGDFFGFIFYKYVSPTGFGETRAGRSGGGVRGEGEMGRRGLMGRTQTSNIQHPTTNAEHRI
jgi:hypothetical protein